MTAVELARAACLILIIGHVLVLALRRNKWLAWLEKAGGEYAEHGVTLSDDEKVRWVARPAEGGGVEVQGFVEGLFPPGADPERVGGKDSSLLKVPLTGGGLLVLTPDLVEPLLGPLPPVPRVRTGSARFDKAFATFAQGGDLPRWPTGTPFLSPDDLAFLQAHGLRWLRWNDDLLEVAFEPRSPPDTVPLLAFAHALRRRGQGRAVATPSAEAPPLPSVRVSSASHSFWFAVIFTMAFLPVLAGVVPRFFTPLRDAVSLHVCGAEGIRLGNDYALCPDGREVMGTAWLASIWFWLAPVLAWFLVKSTGKLLRPAEQPVAE
ncbi:hypothetical protein HPC49_17785 [Pyxidicoccus fallax]|uniref:Uncharacterized protein n=1 Tax=Pyxidicoccus fallax TaxID=394095 RepID=A0A848LBU0_9BACT|nr:hypothetical protein [Pyxidicoccus fallax]NMO16127.1 hypothetical protein [Pyxidicoccus fallax]NPC80063.1 hypothetical protein [Pyxidicoccus fallax]